MVLGSYPPPRAAYPPPQQAGHPPIQQTTYPQQHAAYPQQQYHHGHPHGNRVGPAPQGGNTTVVVQGDRGRDHSDAMLTGLYVQII